MDITGNYLSRNVSYEAVLRTLLVSQVVTGIRELSGFA
jgi:hypothetical protein